MNLASLIKAISKLGFLFHYYVIIICLFVKFYCTKIYRFLTLSTDAQHLNPFQKSHPDVFVHHRNYKILFLDDIIIHDGYQFQTFEAQTQDNAFVTFWRIRSANKQCLNQKYPVLIQHGLLDCSMSWFLHEDITQTLPYILASQGYDVWIGNNRGTKYSSKNSQTKQNYWHFCLDHFIKYDQPALINKVLAQTNKQKLIYIGHSQGSTQFIFGLGQNEYLREKIHKFFAFGLVTSFQNLTEHNLLDTLERFSCLEILQKVGFKAVLVLPEWMNRKFGVLTYNLKVYLETIISFINCLCGKTTQNNLDTSRLGVMVAHQPGGTSVRSVIQWIQAYRNGKIRRFDYGINKNMQLYGSQHPPQYTFDHLKKIDFKSYIFRGTKDAVISDKDFQNMKSYFSQSNLEVFQVQDFAHLDYAWSVFAKGNIYDKIIQILRQEEKQQYYKLNSQSLQQTSQSQQSQNS